MVQYGAFAMNELKKKMSRLKGSMGKRISLVTRPRIVFHRLDQMTNGELVIENQREATNVGVVVWGMVAVLLSFVMVAMAQIVVGESPWEYALAGIGLIGGVHLLIGISRLVMKREVPGWNLALWSVWGMAAVLGGGLGMAAMMG